MVKPLCNMLSLSSLWSKCPKLAVLGLTLGMSPISCVDKHKRSGAQAEAPEPSEPAVLSVDEIGTPMRSSEPVVDPLRERGLERLRRDERCSPPQLGQDVGFVGVAVCSELSNGEEVRVRDGGILYSGDEVRIYLQSSEPAYVYVVQVEDEQGQMLWPVRVDDSQVLMPGGLRIVPPQDEWMLRLDHSIGTLRLFVIASRTPMRDADANLYKLLQRMDNGSITRVALGVRGRKSIFGGAKHPPVRPQPETSVEEKNLPGGRVVSLDERGIVREKRSGQLRGSLDANGVMVVEFQIEHRAPRRTTAAITPAR